jgi:hypothetical protein
MEMGASYLLTKKPDRPPQGTVPFFRGALYPRDKPNLLSQASPVAHGAMARMAANRWNYEPTLKAPVD